MRRSRQLNQQGYHHYFFLLASQKRNAFLTSASGILSGLKTSNYHLFRQIGPASRAPLARVGSQARPRDGYRHVRRGRLWRRRRCRQSGGAGPPHCSAFRAGRRRACRKDGRCARGLSRVRRRSARLTQPEGRRVGSSRAWPAPRARRVAAIAPETDISSISTVQARTGLASRKWRSTLKERGAYYGQIPSAVQQGIRGGGHSGE